MIKRTTPIFISILLFATAIYGTLHNINNKSVIKQTSTSIHNFSKSEKLDNNSEKTDAQNNKNVEMRGVWVTYMDLDMQNESDKSESSFRNKFEKIAKTSKNKGFNTLIVQVRPFSDALYNSAYFPFSHILTGTQGQNPEYDALKIMCEICRENNLFIHAWINPYRIQTLNTPENLCEENPYIMENSLGKECNGGIFYDPSKDTVRELIIKGVVEIAQNYDIDGIQFDDYFYPTTDEDFDKIEYEEYVEAVGESNSMELDNWRLANVNMLICETYKAIHSLNKNIVFGISPQGNINNNAQLYADVFSWCTCKGFVDYICPQLYFSLENPALSFENSLNNWLSLDFNENVNLYVGLAGYKAGSEDYDENTWLLSDDILEKEYEIVKKTDKVSGIMLYSYASFENENAEKEINNLSKELN